VHFDPTLKKLLVGAGAGPDGEGLSSTSADREVPVIARLHDPDVVVPGLRQVARFGRIVTGRVRLGELVSVRGDHNVASLKATRALAPSLDVSRPEVFAGERPLDWRAEGVRPLTGRGVLIGSADWGLDFAHSAFRDAEGRTRIRVLWDQRGGPTPSSPAPFGYGRVFTRAEIDHALASADPYTTLGYDPLWSDPFGTGTHGTHVLSIAAGSHPEREGLAPGAELIFVHLRGDDTRPEDSLGDSVRLLEALRFMCDQAGDEPLVIGLSLGMQGGAHDGSSLVEQALDAMVEEVSGRFCVMSTGNYFTARAHAGGTLRTGETVQLRWEVPANAMEPELEVWYPRDDALRLELRDPSGATVCDIGLGEHAEVREGEQIVVSAFQRPFDPNNGDNQINVFLWPEARPGRWTVALHGEQIQAGRFDAWIERDDLAGQSRFAVEDADSSSTTGTICNGHNTIAVGAYDARDPDRELLDVSSVGPTRDGRAKPTLVAPGVGIVAARSSRFVGGQRARDEWVAKSGTSMASPHVTGCIALLLEAMWPARPTSSEMIALLQSSARPAPPAHPMPTRFGAGRLDVLAALQAARPRPAPARVRIETREMLPLLAMLLAIEELLARRPASARGVATRRDITRIAATERTRMRAAFEQLQHDGVLTQMAAVHRRFMPLTHGLVAGVEQASARFPWWNRLLVHGLERALRSGPDAHELAVHTWRWSDVSVPGLVSGAEVEALLSEPDVERFSRGLELLHARVHAWSALHGGRSSLARPETAALDPMFWPLHAELDRLFTRWQQRHATAIEPAAHPASWRVLAEIAAPVQLGYQYELG
jgi:subtilisin family serine protease